MSQQKATTIAIPIPMIGRHSDSAWSRKRRRTFVAFLAPAVIVLFAVTILPFIYLVATSFTPLNTTKPNSFRWIGLNNYQSLLADHRFWNSIGVQARLSFWTVLLQMLIGLSFAVLLNARINFREAVRISVLIPMVLPWHGSDLTALHLDMVKKAGAGYMAYRTVPPFAPCNDRTTIAMSAIASGQTSVADIIKKSA